MTSNLFEDLHAQKLRMIETIDKAHSFGWIDDSRKNELISKLENDVLTIGVIGQMKCGKSTFLNAFVFEDDILPSATTPMTAALSVITYGPEKKLIAEFYSADEWEEQKQTAKRDLEGTDPLVESKIKAARELVEKAEKLGGSISQYLGKTQEDSFDNLIEYVGADGKFISITKSVQIFYPKEYLKGVEIVDTPGFNDPIVSREERTKDFLRKADVVLMMLYAGRPFDLTDREILFKNVRQCGMGRVLVGINKYDIPYENGETEDEIREYVAQEIRKACRAYQDDELATLLMQVEPIPVSANMALMSQMPLAKINASDTYKFSYDRALDIFEISSQKELYDKSHITELIAAVRDMIANEKGQILFQKPLNSIMAAGRKLLTDAEKELADVKNKIANLSIPDDELEDKKNDIEKAKRRIEKKVNSLASELDEIFETIIKKGKRELEDAVDSSASKINSIADGLGRMSGISSVRPQIEQEINTLVNRRIKRTVESLGDTAKRKIKNATEIFFGDIQDVLHRFFREELDTDAFVNSVSKEVDLEIIDADLFRLDDNYDGEEENLWDYAYAFLNGATYGVLDNVSNFISHAENVNAIKKIATSLQNDFDPDPYLNHITARKDEIIEKVQNAIVIGLIDKLLKGIEEIQKKITDKAADLETAKSSLAGIKERIKTIESQLQELG